MSNQENLDMVYFSLIGLVYVGDLILGICYNVVFVEQGENMVTIKSCQNSKRYKGIYPPRCNGGNPCQACINIYNERNKC